MSKTGFIEFQLFFFFHSHGFAEAVAAEAVLEKFICKQSLCFFSRKCFVLTGEKWKRNKRRNPIVTRGIVLFVFFSVELVYLCFFLNEIYEMLHWWWNKYVLTLVCTSTPYLVHPLLGKDVKGGAFMKIMEIFEEFLIIFGPFFPWQNYLRFSRPSTLCLGM
jgi:hypothetical protein